MKKDFLKAVVLTFFAASVVAAPFIFHGEELVLPSSALQNSCRTVILDAGHGGEDGGAVALDGSFEKGS